MRELEGFVVVTRLKFERINQKLSLEYVYRQSGVRPIDISLIERGRLIPTPLQLAQLASVLGVPTSALLKPVLVKDADEAIEAQRA